MKHIQLNDQQRHDWLRLMLSENVGAASFYQLVNRYGGAGRALEILPTLSRRGGMGRGVKVFPKNKADKAFDDANRINARFVALGEADYPPLLRHIDQPPPLLCMLGRFEIQQKPMIAIVGSRNSSALGISFSKQLAQAFGEAGYGVVSGLARGVDTAAHVASLNTGTIAVSACGLDKFYPPENKKLQHQIGEKGILISEMIPGTPPHAKLFPKRNRIISGISMAVVVVEAALRSGSLITARLAAEQGREVFAVPGSPLDPRAQGTNKLIREGAGIVTNPQDVIDEVQTLGLPQADLFMEKSSVTDLKGLSEQETKETIFVTDDSFENIEGTQSSREKILSLMGPTAVSIDELVRASHLAPSQIQVLLLELELAGQLEGYGTQYVSLRAG